MEFDSISFQAVCCSLVESLMRKAILNNKSSCIIISLYIFVLYENERWTLDIYNDYGTMPRTSGTKLLRKTNGYTKVDQIRNKSIRIEINIEPAEYELQACKQCVKNACWEWMNEWVYKGEARPLRRWCSGTGSTTLLGRNTRQIRCCFELKSTRFLEMTLKCK